jgi:hypothetical protein
MSACMHSFAMTKNIIFNCDSLGSRSNKQMRQYALVCMEVLLYVSDVPSGTSASQSC